jgi:serine/threonine-protein kinase
MTAVTKYKMTGSTTTNKAKAAKRTGLRLTKGRRLGKYRLVKCLGEGGSCEVWKARDNVEGIWVALKIPLVDVNGVRDNQKLLREIRFVAKLRHPHIMPVKNADIIDGYAVLATELSVGTLEDCSKPMSVRRIFSIIVQVLDGLAYAHQNRLVHCDVTPGNIFLFPNGRAVLGDFGISLKLKGRMKTIEDFGTPGYVAPEQAYGYPTYRSDCFAVGLILYEYLTGILPRWPFHWPMKGFDRLRERTNVSVVKFLKKSLAVDPAKRFANADKMLTALSQALPRNLQTAFVVKNADRRKVDWRKARRGAFLKRYSKVLNPVFRCVNCSEPISESMLVCPWCGTDRNRFDRNTQLDRICPRCHKGISNEWHYCPWCYGSGFQTHPSERRAGIRYHSRCKHCKGKVARFMRYCPWCRRKIRKPWQCRPFPETCSRCGWSVDSDFWRYCPWCKQNLTA